MRSAAFLSTSPKPAKLEVYLEHHFERLNAWYGRLLARTLRHPKLISVSSLLLFLVSLLLIFQVRQEFVPLQDQDFVIINGQAPPGSSLAYTISRAKEIEAILGQHRDIDRFFTSAGAGGPSAEINQFFMLVKLNPGRHEKRAMS
jgi:multidrug efflux pump subunit AcrB